MQDCDELCNRIFKEIDFGLRELTIFFVEIVGV